ncbi:MAG TPA: hypothetical protein VF310_11285 [Vicinamibacteria bacterium]
MSAEMGRAALAAGAPRLDEVDRAILRTVTYAALFESPLELDELQRGLMDVALDAEELRRRLQRPPLSSRLTLRDGLVHPRGRDGWRELRARRRGHTRILVERHRRALAVLARCPFVRLAALSGACAHDNASDLDDDVDVFLVARESRVWAVYLLLVVASRLLGVRRSLCLNYLIDERALALPERDVFTAAEIVGLRPLAGGDGYRDFVRANGPLLESFPNFLAGFEETAAALPRAGARPWLERLLDWTVAPLLEVLSRRVMGARLRRKGQGHPGVVLTPHRLKLHAEDHRPRLMAAFTAALARAEAAPAEDEG